MTSYFDTQSAALKTGMFYAGRHDLYKNENGKSEATLEEIMARDDVKVIECQKVNQFGEEREMVTIEFKNKDGVLVQIGTAPFRNGFDCWAFDPKTGMGMRIYG